MEDKDIGHCYAIEFDNGTVKIGRTTNIIRRLSQHRSSATRFCVDIQKIVITEAVTNHKALEKTLLDFACSLKGSSSKGEYFNGLSIIELQSKLKKLHVSFVVTESIPTSDSEGRLIVKLDKSFDKCDFYGEFSSRSVVEERVISAIRENKLGLPPSVICQRAVSKKLFISREDVMCAIKNMEENGTLISSVLIHNKTKIESTRYKMP